MSMFSGKCDLYDHIMMSKMYDVPGGYVSDELECFRIFKEKTGGVIYQQYPIKVTELNRDLVKDHCKSFDYTCEEYTVPDKRCKSGVRKEKAYKYTYLGNEKPLGEINKLGVYITVEVKFDTLLDIIPYYPYLVSMCYSDKEREVVFITRESYTDSSFKSGLASGYLAGMKPFYDKTLQEHYLDVCKNYYLYRYDERVRLEPINVDTSTGIGTTQEPIDDLHPIEYVWSDRHHHLYYSDPVLIDDTHYQMHKNDVETKLRSDDGSIAMIKYVAKCEMPKVLG